MKLFTQTFMVVALAALGLVAVNREAQVTADVVFKNGNVYTVNSSRPRAESIAVKADRIVFVGSNNEAQRYVGKSTRVVEGKWTQAAQLTAEGFRFGLIMALAAVGLSLIFGTTGLTNFAHGELVSLGALLTWWISTGNLPFLPDFGVNTQYPLWVPNLFGSAFYIFLLRQFFLGIPRDLFEAARIDGDGYFSMFRRIALPLAKPALAFCASRSPTALAAATLPPVLWVPRKSLLRLSTASSVFPVSSSTSWA